MVKIVWCSPIIFTLFLLSSCNFSESKVDLQEGFVYTQADLNYQQVNNRIIAPYCLSCHSAAAGNLGSLNLETLESLQSRIPMLERTVLINRSMPKAGSPQLPYKALEMLSAWLRGGAPE